jgi:hypothetical protein
MWWKELRLVVIPGPVEEHKEVAGGVVVAEGIVGGVKITVQASRFRC